MTELAVPSLGSNFGDREQSTATLTLPHPRSAERGFGAVPWPELDPEAVLPGIGRVSTLSSAGENVQRYPAEALT